jgi:rhamnosyltransferase subunit B
VLNVLLASWGSAGDVMPFIGIGSELRRRGHDVTLIASPAFARQAESAHLSFAGAGTIEEYKMLMADAELWDSRTFLQRLFVHWSPSVEPFYARIVESLRPSRTVLVAHALAAAARVAQEKFDLPMASVYLVPAQLPNSHESPHPSGRLGGWIRGFAGSGRRLARYRAALLQRATRCLRTEGPIAPFRAAIDHFRATVQLPPISSPFFKWVASPQRIIGAWPEWFASPNREWPRQTALTGFPLYPPVRSGSEDTTASWRKSIGSPPIVFTTGSLASSQREFFETAAGTCAILGHPGIFVSPHGDHIPQNLPPNIVYMNYVPFGELFEHCAAVVHHGGIGTSWYALAAGLPQVIRPMAGDQLDTAKRLERLGVGRVISTKRIRPTELAAVVRSGLESDRVLDRCRYWRSRVKAEESLCRTAELIEDLAA